MSNEQNLEIGQVVWMKSGGPAMTIISTKIATMTQETSHICTWFDYDQLIQTGNFQESVLTTIRPDF